MTGFCIKLFFDSISGFIKTTIIYNLHISQRTLAYQQKMQSESQNHQNQILITCISMKSTIFYLILCFSVLNTADNQNCLDSNEQPVSWWVILKVPPMIGYAGYAYYDSTMKSSSFQYSNKTVDLQASPLTQTFAVINKDKLERVAWNDQKPNNQTSSSKAHSKGLIAYGRATGRGFYIVHSIPKYPAFLSDHTIYMTIPAAQQVYGQHIACFSLSLYELNIIASHLQIINPLIYEYDITLRAGTQNLYDLANGNLPVVKQLFQFYQMNPTNFTLNAIFKNNAVNGSIFEDGLVKWLKPGNVIAETWGRPLQAPWCSGTFSVTNVQQIIISDTIQWDESQDHSKWTLSGNQYSCFGDMNRMESQWKRGGAFYCLEQPSLNAALQKIVNSSDACAKNNTSQNFHWQQSSFNLKFQ